MAKVGVSKEELYPVYFLTVEGEETDDDEDHSLLVDVEIEVDEATLARWREAGEAWSAVQNEIEEMWTDAFTKRSRHGR